MHTKEKSTLKIRYPSSYQCIKTNPVLNGWLNNNETSKVLKFGVIFTHPGTIMRGTFRVNYSLWLKIGRYTHYSTFYSYRWRSRAKYWIFFEPSALKWGLNTANLQKSSTSSGHVTLHGMFIEWRNTTMVFCYHNCSNVLWEKIVLVWGKNWEKSLQIRGRKAENL